jgi:hypothetical protein
VLENELVLVGSWWIAGDKVSDSVNVYCYHSISVVGRSITGPDTAKIRSLRVFASGVLQLKTDDATPWECSNAIAAL